MYLQVWWDQAKNCVIVAVTLCGPLHLNVCYTNVTHIKVEYTSCLSHRVLNLVFSRGGGGGHLALGGALIRSGAYRPRPFLFRTRCARYVLWRPRADILLVRPSRWDNKMYVLDSYGGVVPAVCSNVIIKYSKPFIRNFVRAASRPAEEPEK